MSKDDIKPGEQLTLAQINRLRKQAQGGGKAAAGNGSGAGQGGDAKPSDGLTVEQLREALTAKGVEIPADAKKADLQKLLDEAA